MTSSPFWGLVSWAYLTAQGICCPTHTPSASQQAQTNTLSHSSFPSLTGAFWLLWLQPGAVGVPRVSQQGCPLWSRGFRAAAIAAGPANPPCPQNSRTRTRAAAGSGPSHVPGELMLHHSRGVTQEELGLTLSGGVWFGHFPHNCPPCPPGRVGRAP